MKRILTTGLFILTAAAVVSFAQTSSNCSSNEDDNVAAVYNFVPENALQADFRQLSKTEEGFVDSLRQNPSLFVEDQTTPVLSAEMMPEMPPITGVLVPPPARSGADFYFKGKINKAAGGFLLTVELHKPSDDSLLNEVKIPFAAAGAEAAGTTAATQMLAFLAAQTQTGHSPQTSGDRLVSPRVSLQIDKLLIKPNEQDPGKVILTDCDGTRLKNREFESYARLDRGATLLGELSGPRRTNEQGEYAGIVSSTVPGVLTQIARLKYTDLLDRPQTVSESQSVVIAGGEGDLWQMRIKFMYVKRERYLAKDLQAHRTDISSTLVSRKADMVFLFKTPTEPNGEVSTDQIKAFNGFGEAVNRNVDDQYQDASHKNYAYGTLDQSPEAAQNVQAFFSIDPGSKEFKFNLSNLVFRGMRDSIGCSTNNGCRTGHDEYVVSTDGADGLSGSGPITPEMTKSGVYTFIRQEKQPLPANHKKNEIIDETHEGSYEYHQIEVKISRVSPKQAKITR